MSLRNRVALVTGGSRGIGRGIATRLGQDGARVAIAYRSNKAAAQQTLRQIQAVGVECVAVETDISDPARAGQLVKTVVERFGRLDIVVNNVGDFKLGHGFGEFAGRLARDFFFQFVDGALCVPGGAAAHAQRTLGTNYKSGSGRSRTSVWAGEDFRVCGGQGGGSGVVAFAGAGRSEKRNYG